MKIQSQVVAHSLSPQGDELLSVLITFPRFILAELNTHRMLSKNSASSRAIPFKKMAEVVQNNPFIPIAWQKEHKGMQGTKYFLPNVDAPGNNVDDWLEARDNAVKLAKSLSENGVTKQLCNRLLEPFMWHTVLISGTEWLNFFELRCPQYEYETADGFIYFKSKKDWIKLFESTLPDKEVLDSIKNESDLFWLKLNKGQAEIHMMALAESIYDSWKESTPKQLEAGEWHIPFENKMLENKWFTHTKDVSAMVKVSTAMAAHTSYTTVGNEPVKSCEKWIELHDKLIAYNPPHSSPMEHCARAMTDDEYYHFIKGEIDILNLNESEDENYLGWCRNYRGFIQYRHIIENGNI